MNGWCLLLAITAVASCRAEESIFDPIDEDDGLANLGLNPCPATSYELSQYGPDDVLDPCILYDITPSSSANTADGEPSFTEVALVQVTPSGCHNHRDGANTAVSLLNDADDGRGVAVGYEGETYIKFRLISIVGGNNNNVGNDHYSRQHELILDEVFEHVDNVQFILGSCSFASAADKPVALKRRRIVLSQVGPPGFYLDVETNPYVFGIHVNSDTYPLPALKALQFHLDAINVPTSSQQVRVVYRDRSEFFYSTCRSAIDTATEQGFDVTAIEFNPDGDESSAGVPNSQNVDYLEWLADRLCPPDESNNAPAVFACVQGGDADVMLARMRSNGCRPTLAWFTTATWGWATDHPDVIPYFQGGGQWHNNFVYSDQYFASGQAVLDYGLEKFGYAGSYDHVVSYAMPMLIVELITSFFRIADAPNVTDVFANRYEVLRRSLVNINAHTIFGPVSFNEFQRNQGRGAAGTQWITESGGDAMEFVLGCTSPLDQADASIVIPAPSALSCSPGSHIALELVESDPAILEDKCSACPADSFAPSINAEFECTPCPDGSNSEEGAENCVATEDNLTPTGLKVLGYIFVAVSWVSALGYIVWLYRNRTDTVVKMGQPEALFLLCVGAIISTSAIIPLTLAEAAPGESTAGASAACRSIPFLYSLGWVLMYSSLTAKSWRLLKVARNANRARRVKVSVRGMYAIIVVVLLMDLAILISWILVSPLEYARSDVSTTLDESTGVLTIETTGQCQSSSSHSMWVFLGPIIAIHVGLMIVTNVVLWLVRGISDRYQEQKYVALASVYICELLLLGLPILFAVQESGTARYIVIAGVIFLTDTGVLALIFIPKIKYTKEGLPEGMTVAASIIVPRQSSVRFGSSQPTTRHTFAYGSGGSQSGGQSGQNGSGTFSYGRRASDVSGLSSHASEAEKAEDDIEQPRKNSAALDRYDRPAPKRMSYNKSCRQTLVDHGKEKNEGADTSEDDNRFSYRDLWSSIVEDEAGADQLNDAVLGADRPNDAAASVEDVEQPAPQAPEREKDGDRTVPEETNGIALTNVGDDAPATPGRRGKRERRRSSDQ